MDGWIEVFLFLLLSFCLIIVWYVNYFCCFVVLYIHFILRYFYCIDYEY